MIKVGVIGLRELIQKFRVLPDRIQENIVSAAGGITNEEMILRGIRESIDAVGLRTRTGRLKRSFRVVAVEKTSNGLVYRIGTDAPYAMRLNYGSAPSGFYTPGGGRGQSGGNRPYRYLDSANVSIAASLSQKVDKAITKAISDLGLK